MCINLFGIFFWVDCYNIFINNCYGVSCSGINKIIMYFYKKKMSLN